jgi:hypothetical protein
MKNHRSPLLDSTTAFSRITDDWAAALNTKKITVKREEKRRFRIEKMALHCYIKVRKTKKAEKRERSDRQRGDGTPGTGETTFHYAFFGDRCHHKTYNDVNKVSTGKGFQNLTDKNFFNAKTRIR